eukprot:450433_1
MWFVCDTFWACFTEKAVTTLKCAQSELIKKLFNMKVKIVNNGDIRLWRYTHPSCDDLHSFITTSWNIASHSYIAQYEDDENDLMTIVSSTDLNDAFNFAKSQNKQSLKIYIRFVVSGSRPPTQPQYPSFRAMILDFLENETIKSVLPQLFVTLIDNIRRTSFKQTDARYAKYIKLKKIKMPMLAIRHKMKFDGFTQSEINSFMTEKAPIGGVTGVEVITQMIYGMLKTQPYASITDHVFYAQHGETLIAYVAEKVNEQQSLYSHFRLCTIQQWVQQLMDTAYQSILQNKTCDSLKDIVLEMNIADTTDFGDTIHFGVHCDGCNAYPMIGDRYKCALCSDYDLCGACEATGKHGDHPLIKFRKASKYHQHAAFNGLNEVVEGLCSSQKEEELKRKCVKCVCGESMVYVKGKDAYTWCEWVYCDRCNAKFLNEGVFNCPKGKDKVHHKNGYDLCVNCALYNK